MKGIDAIFNPVSIAVIGASADKVSVGFGIIANLTKGCVFRCEYCKPFDGKIYPVNPKYNDLLGLKCHPDVTSIEGDIDLAVIAVPAKIVPSVMRQCVKKKVKGAIIISAGFGEMGAEGKSLQNDIISIARKGKIRVVGPNCLGIISPHNNMNASFAPSMPPKGNIAFVSQSGALADSIIDWAIEKRYGFSAIISYGNRADLDVHDFLDWLARDDNTKAIAIYMEGLSDGRLFMEVAKKVSGKKPVIVLKAGKTSEGAKAISSHTGSLAGSYAVYSAAFRQCGIEQAETVEDLFDKAKALANQPVCRKNAVAIVTNAGGCGVLCADACSDFGINVVGLRKSTIRKLDRSKKMHPAYSRGNPLDIVGDALPDRYEAAINTVLGEDYISGLIVIQTLQTMTRPEENAAVIIKARKMFPEKPIISTYMGGKFSQAGIDLLEKAGIPDYNEPRKSAMAMKTLIKRGENLKGLL